MREKVGRLGRGLHTSLPHFPYCTLFAPKILHNLCFSFPLSITAVPREIEDNVYAKKKVIIERKYIPDINVKLKRFDCYHLIPHKF